MPTGTIGVFRNKVFAGLWVGSVLSNIGGQVQMVGAAWLMAELTTSQGMVSLVQTATTLPVVVGTMAAGVLADTYDRRRIMLLAQCFMTVASALLVVVAVQDGLTPWLLLSFTFLIGCGTALHNPSWHSTIGGLVPAEDLPSAISLNAMGMNVTRAVGPATGGFIVAAFGAAAAFAFNAVSYLALIWTLVFWRPAVRTVALPPERFWGSLATGLRFFANSARPLKASARGFMFGLGAIPLQSLMPLVTRDLLGGGPIAFGILLGCFGSGAVAAAVANPWVRQRFSSETIARLGFVISGVAAVVAGTSTWLALTAPFVFAAGFCWLASFSLLNVSVQLSTPKWVLGRVLSIYLFWMFSGMALGAWLWGAVAEYSSVSIALYASAAALCCGALSGAWIPLSALSADELEPVEGPATPSVALNVLPTTGPVQLSIEYLIDERDVPEFLSRLEERRRLRLQEGCRQWELQHDLANPERWVETYRFSTWLDYLRHGKRRVKADVVVIEKLRALHRGSKPPTVNRAIVTESARAARHFDRVPDTSAETPH